MGSLSTPLATVHRKVPELISPATPTPRELKPLSDVDDQNGLRYHVPFVMFYENNTGNKRDPVEAIRDGIAKALVFYYPLAGRLVEGPARKLTMDCTGEGVMFIEADADVTMSQLGHDIVPPFPYIKEFLYDVPGSADIVGCPVLLIQVTRLLCGGFVVAARLNHTSMDAVGLVQFLTAVGEIAQGASAPSVLPVWQREFLSARNPPRITCRHFEFDEIEDGASKCSLVSMEGIGEGLAHRSFLFGPQEIKAIRQHLPQDLQKSSRFEIVTACIFRCRTIAVDVDPNESVRLSVIVTGRGKDGCDVPKGYYGNAVNYPAALSKAGEVCNKPLGFAVELVKNAKSQMSQEYMQSVADFMVLKGRPIYNQGWLFMVSDNSRIGFDDLDLGWGKPKIGGPSVTCPLISYYLRYKSDAGEDLIVAPMCLPQAAMDKFQAEIDKLTGKVR